MNAKLSGVEMLEKSIKDAIKKKGRPWIALFDTPVEANTNSISHPTRPVYRGRVTVHSPINDCVQSGTLPDCKAAKVAS